jgi:hypothetical protein
VLAKCRSPPSELRRKSRVSLRYYTQGLYDFSGGKANRGQVIDDGGKKVTRTAIRLRDLPDACTALPSHNSDHDSPRCRAVSTSYPWHLVLMVRPRHHFVQQTLEETLTFPALSFPGLIRISLYLRRPHSR